MKIFITIFIIIVIAYAGIKLSIPKPDASVSEASVVDTTTTDTAPTLFTSGTQEQTIEIANDLVTVDFKGFGPGKVHTGSFGNVKSTLSYENGAFGGSVIIDMNTMTTDTEKLTAHLKTKDFFDTTKYPTATFVPTKWNMTDAAQNKFTMTGELTLHGVKKTISFPVLFEEVIPAPNVRLAYTKSYKSTFTLSLKDFGINQTFANEQFEISLVLPVR